MPTTKDIRQIASDRRAIISFHRTVKRSEDLIRPLLVKAFSEMEKVYLAEYTNYITNYYNAQGIPLRKGDDPIPVRVGSAIAIGATKKAKRHIDAMNRVLDGIGNAAIEAGYKSAPIQGVVFGGGVDIGREQFRELAWVKPYAGMTEKDSTRIDKIVQAGVTEGKGIGKIRADIRREFEGFKTKRADLIIRTESTRYQNAGLLAGYDQNPVVGAKIWVATLDSATRAWHRNPPQGVNGQIRLLDEPFDVPGHGQQQFPSEFNCRCLINSVIDADLIKQAYKRAGRPYPGDYNYEPVGAARLPVNENYGEVAFDAKDPIGLRDKIPGAKTSRQVVNRAKKIADTASQTTVDEIAFAQLTGVTKMSAALEKRLARDLASYTSAKASQKIADQLDEVLANWDGNFEDLARVAGYRDGLKARISELSGGKKVVVARPEKIIETTRPIPIGQKVKDVGSETLPPPPPIEAKTAVPASIKSEAISKDLRVSLDRSAKINSEAEKVRNELNSQLTKLKKSGIDTPYDTPEVKKIVKKMTEITELAEEERKNAVTAIKSILRKPADSQAVINVKYTGTKAAQKEAQKVFDEIREILPSSIFEGGKTEINVALTKASRGSYDHISKKMMVHRSANVDQMIHEFGHHIEKTSPRARKAARDFLSKRTRGESAENLGDVIRGAGFGKTEVTKKDKFFNAYVGKVYEHDATEVISMGIEQMLKDPATFLKQDEEHFNLILKIMTGEI